MIKILLLLVISLIGCNNPNLTICVSDPARGGFQCSNSGSPRFFLGYKDSEDYIAMPPDDARTVFERCRQP